MRPKNSKKRLSLEKSPKKINDHLAHSLMIMVNPTYTLVYDVNDINIKVTNFKKEMVQVLIDNFKQYELHKQCKDIEVFKKAIENDKRDNQDMNLFILLISRYQNINIVKEDEEGGFKTFLVGSSSKCIFLGKDDTIKRDDLSYNELISMVYKDINLEKLLMDELKEIAQNLKLPMFKIVDGKKKTLLKAELKDSISQIIFSNK